MIVENPPKSLAWLMLLAAFLGAAAIIGFSNLPRQQAEADRTRTETQLRVEQFELERPLREAEINRQVAEVNREIAEIEESVRVMTARNNQQLAREAQQDEVELKLAEGAGQALIVVAAASTLSLVSIITYYVIRLIQINVVVARPPSTKTADPWQDPAFRRKQRELARMLEQLNRLPRQAAPAEPKASAAPSASKPSVPGGNGYKEPEPEHEMKPPI